MEFHLVDVFALGPASGNPLVVVTADGMPPDARMQALAAHFGVSETVFAVPGAPPRLRIFTPEAEIPMAGHPLVGTAWVLRRLGWIGDAAVLSAPGGEVAVEADDDGARMTRTGPAPRGEAAAATLAGLLGARALGPAPIWDAGMPQAMLRVDDLAALRPDHEGLRARGDAEGWAGVSAYTLRDEPTGTGTGTGTHEHAPVAEVRHFAAPIGIAEDPVTGSAAAALGACLAARGVIGGAEPALTVLQGHHMGRPGRVDVRVRMGPDGPDAVTVGGAVVPSGHGVPGGTGGTGAIGPAAPAG